MSTNHSIELAILADELRHAHAYIDGHPAASSVSRVATLLDALTAGSDHEDYPHEPGRMYLCAGCDERCHCAELSPSGELPCVWPGHRGRA